MNLNLSEVQWEFADGGGEEDDRRLVPSTPIELEVGLHTVGLHVEALPVRFVNGQQVGVCATSDNQLQQALSVDDLAGAYATVHIPRSRRPKGSWTAHYVILIMPHSR